MTLPAGMAYVCDYCDAMRTPGDEPWATGACQWGYPANDSRDPSCLSDRIMEEAEARNRRASRWVWGSLLTALALLLCLAFFTRPAKAHSWYPVECCNEVHCREIPATELSREPTGWRLRDGRMIPHHAARTTPAPHQGFHICEWRAGETIPESYEQQALVVPKGKALCFFIPDAQF